MNRTLVSSTLDEEARYWAIALGEGGELWNECQESKFIAIGWDAIGDLSKYADQEAIYDALIEYYKHDAKPNNNSLCCWQFSHEMKKGDRVIAKIGRRRVLGVGTVDSNYIYDHSRKEYRNMRYVRWHAARTVDLPSGVVLPLKTLTDVTDNNEIRGFVRENYPENIAVPSLAPDMYEIDDALVDLFMPRNRFEAILEGMHLKKNVILQGPPGVGKTFVARRVAWTLLGAKDNTRIQMIQFHQSYAYEDFVQGWRPNSDGGFQLKNGTFYEFCDKARMDRDRPYVFIIDEINRGNLSKILGELMMLIEPDKRGAEYAIPLTYSESGERFSVPENIHVLGLMNTADRSLAMVDYALRRRFRFVDLRPGFASDDFKRHLSSHGASEELVSKVIKRMTGLNRMIESDHKNFGYGFTIGHSFFCLTDSRVKADEGWYRTVINEEIEPLIHEYWFDKPDRAKRIIQELLA